MKTEVLVMSRLLTGLVIANLALLLWTLSGRSTYAQRPPEVNSAGEAYLRVNINPTSIPPMVNINPEGQVPRVEVTRMPEITIPQNACDNPRNYETGVSRSVTGPMRVTFLNSSQTTPITFVDGANRNYRVTLNAAIPLGTSIYLRADQKLEFDSAMLYSGCRG
jgi:hypothetical protein